MKKLINTFMMAIYAVNLQLFAFDGDSTASAALSDEMKIFYDTSLLNNAEPDLVHDQFGTKYPIPKGKGKTIEFRRVCALPKNLKTIEEGVTPPKKNLKVESIQATVDQYGDWILSSDLLELTAVDPILVMRTKALGSQAGRTLDTVTREVINGGTNIIFCDDVSGATPVEKKMRSELKDGCHLTFDSFFKAAAQLKTQNAKPFGTDFIAIIHPYSSYDVMSNPQWQDVSKYEAVEQIFSGEIGKIGKVRFVESSEAKVFLPDEIISGARRLFVATAVTSSTTSVVVEGEYETITPTTPITVYAGGNANTITKITKGNGMSTITLGTAVTSLAVGNIICGRNAGKFGDAVFSTLVIAQDAYGVTDVTGGGLQHIVKQLGSGGTADPLNQRSSSGWKALKVAKRLNEQYLVRIESVNAYSKKINEN